MALSIIGVDADDTLWHTETVFRLTHKRFNELLADFADEEGARFSRSLLGSSGASGSSSRP